LDTLSELRPTIEREAGRPTPQLIRVLECQDPLALSARHSLGGVDSVEIGRGARRALRERGARQLQLLVPDPWMSRSHARLLRGDRGWHVEDAGSRNGTLVNGAPIERAPLADGDVLEIGHTFFLFRGEVAEPHSDPADLEASVLSPAVAELASLSVPLAEQISRLVRISDSLVSVIVQGETGTGKERIAHAIHTLSRRSGLFVAVNCGALPHTLIETELFGCRRGAFTGAQDRPGLVRTADRGTLFLDEVGDLPLAAQVALLRVLQERQVLAVGATQPVPVDFRIVCATQDPLEALVKAGLFRSDVLARLSGMVIKLPPLRERREDLGLILVTLLRKLAPERAGGVVLEKEAGRALLSYPFPLNIRELEKALERALALAGGGPIRLEHLALEVGDLAPAQPRGAGASPPPLAPKDVELRRQLVSLLEEHGGNLSATARAMGKARVQIRRWLRRYQIDPARFRR
jgi:transcriptional regulator with PAS, ATPase and Fis domain